MVGEYGPDVFLYLSQQLKLEGGVFSIDGKQAALDTVTVDIPDEPATKKVGKFSLKGALCVYSCLCDCPEKVVESLIYIVGFTERFFR